MSSEIQNDLPGGSWTHSFEEDANDVEVFRPSASFPFPPSRQPRRTLEFGAGGQATVGMPGPDDRLQRTPAAVQSLGMNRFLMSDGRVLEVVESGPDVLKFKAR